MELSADKVSLIRANRRLVSNVQLHVQAGELIGLIGPNGAGKSTLLSMLAGLVIPDEGSVYLDKTRLDTIDVQSRSRAIAWVEQSGPVNWPLTVERIVTLGRRPHLSSWHKPTERDKTAIEHAITATDCQTLRHQDATTLSGGERTRMLLARALACEPTILLADEPVAALDLGHQLQTMELLRSFATGSHSCVVVLHDLSLAARYCDRLYLMNQGSIHADGAPTSVLSDAHLESVYGVKVMSGGTDVPWIVPVRQITD